MTLALVELLVQETMDREIISPSLWKKIQQQWQDDDFFGPRGYSNELDIAPEGWEIGPGDSDAFQATDELFLAASKKFESADESSEPELELFKVASQHIEKSELEDRFAEPILSKEIADLRQSAFLVKKAQKSTAWGLKIWSAWAEHRRNNLTDFVQMTVSSMNFWLCRLVDEARCVDGQPYSPNTLYQICCALRRAQRE